MFRTIWILISTLAIANLLALGGFVAWLGSSNRLNAERVERLRTVLAVTIEDEQSAAERKAVDQNVADGAAREAAKVGTAPLTADQKLEAQAVKEEVGMQQARRVQRETSDLIKTLVEERADLERQKSEFDARVAAFDAMRARIAEEEGSEQFQKAVGLYQSVKPPEAKNMMRALIKAGQTEQVVSYLNALQPRVAAKIITEFQNEDASLAANLLENLRMRGTAVAPTNPTPVAASIPKES